MQKIAFNPHVETANAVGRQLGAHVVIGAGIGAAGRASNDKFHGKKVKAKNVLRAGVGGALAGGVIGSTLNPHLVTGIPHIPEAVAERLRNEGAGLGVKVRNIPHRIIGTGAGAALGGAYGYKAQKDFNKKQKDQKKRTSPLSTAAAMGGLGASVGHSIGSMSRFVHLRSSAQRVMSGARYAGGTYVPPKNLSVPSWLKGAKTKAEAKKRYHAQAHANHPDLTTDTKEKARRTERMKQINEEWQDFEKIHFSKLAHAAFDELFKIFTGA